jgi:hypothetical protein
MGQMVEHFDTSDFPSSMNKEVVRKFKDETNGVPSSEFVGLKSKIYSFTVGKSTKRTAKGIRKAVSLRDLMMEQYKAALDDMAFKVKQTMIQSRNHKICKVSAT